MLKTVAEFTEPWEAHLFRTRLEAECLFAVVAFDQHVGVNYSVSWALGGVKVQVIEDELEQARAIVQRCHAGEFENVLDAEVGGQELWTCPRCGAQDHTRRRSPSLLLSLAGTFVFGIVLPFRGYVNRCNQCETRWRV